jgi:hypothetical protein
MAVTIELDWERGSVIRLFEAIYTSLRLSVVHGRV